jgi:large subunit ribosomal protein L23
MALFKKDSKNAPAKKGDDTTDYSWVLKGPRVTEKSAFISADNAYTFNVAVDANKIQIKKAIEAQYKVSPLKVNIVNRKPHKETRRGRKVHVAGTKKAMVFLKKGDSIELA